MLLTTPMPSLPPEVVQNAAQGSESGLGPALIGALVGGAFAFGGSWWSQTRANKHSKKLQETAQKESKQLQEQSQADARELQKQHLEHSRSLQKRVELARHCDDLIALIFRRTRLRDSHSAMNDWVASGFHANDFYAEFDQVGARILMWMDDPAEVSYALNRFYLALVSPEILAAGTIQTTDSRQTLVKERHYASMTIKALVNMNSEVRNALVNLPRGPEDVFSDRVQRVVVDFELKSQRLSERLGISPFDMLSQYGEPPAEPTTPKE